MSDDKLIRLSDAIAALTEVAVRFGITGEPQIMILAKEALRAIPAVQPSPDVAALTDTGLLLDAYKAVLVLHRVMDKHGLTAGASAAENIADRIVAAHPEFPGLCALRGAALARLKGGAA